MELWLLSELLLWGESAELLRLELLGLGLELVWELLSIELLLLSVELLLLELLWVSTLVASDGWEVLLPLTEVLVRIEHLVF